MTRSALLPLLALGLATAPAHAQSDPTSAPDTVAVEAPVTVAVEADDAPTAVAPDPDRARALYEGGLSLYRTEDYAGALAKYDEALLYGESYAPAGLGRGQALYNLGRLDDARNALEASVAMARASDASNAGDVAKVARQWLATATSAIETREASAVANAEAEVANAEAEAANAAAEDVEDKVTRASEMLSGTDVDMVQATDAYALLEQARLAGYDPDKVAFYYATALIAMERGEDAVPYAETALANTADGADQSGTYVLLGRAHLAAGHAAEARSAFEAIGDGQAWSSWVPHYIRQVEEMEGGDEG